MLESTITLLATAAITNPWMQSKSMRETWAGHRAVFTNPVRCCSAFVHTFSTSPTSLDSRCSALGPEPGAPDNGQAIDACGPS
jgi:hypothetical protein